jgi:hypothetical protein
VTSPAPQPGMEHGSRFGLDALGALTGEQVVLLQMPVDMATLAVGLDVARPGDGSMENAIVAVIALDFVFRNMYLVNLGGLGILVDFPNFRMAIAASLFRNISIPNRHRSVAQFTVHVPLYDIGMVEDHMEPWFRHGRLMTEGALCHGAGFRLIFEMAKEAGLFRNRHMRSLDDLRVA